MWVFEFLVEISIVLNLHVPRVYYNGVYVLVQFSRKESVFTMKFKFVKFK